MARGTYDTREESRHDRSFGSPAQHCADRRLPPGRGSAQGQRRRHHLRDRRHPDHRPRPRRAGVGNPLHRLPAGDLGRQRRCRRRVPHPPAGRLPDDIRARISQRPARAGQRHHELLPDDPDLGLEQSSAGRSAARRLPGPRPAQRRKAFREGGVSDRPDRGHRARRRACHSHRDLRAAGRRLPRHPRRRAGPGHGGRGRRPTRSGGSSTPLPGSCRHRRRSIARCRCSRRRSDR